MIRQIKNEINNIGARKTIDISKLLLNKTYKQLYFDEHEYSIFVDLLYNSKIPNIKESNIWNNITKKDTPDLKLGVTYITLKSNLILFNYNMTRYTNSNSVRIRKVKELEVYIIGKDMKLIYDIFIEQFNKAKDFSKKYIDVYSEHNISTIKKINFDKIVSKNKDIIINYIDLWKDNEKFYNIYNIPYKTGILLYGPPGTGKTSIAKAIASRLNFKLITVDLASNRLNEVKIYHNSVILLEDIDCLLCNREQDMTPDEKAKLNFALNLIDGVNSKDSTITIATTNYIERLDGALIRDGRFNLKIKMDNFGLDEALEMCKLYKTNPNKILKDESFPISPAYLQNKIIQYKLNQRGLIVK